MFFLGILTSLAFPGLSVSYKKQVVKTFFGLEQTICEHIHMILAIADYLHMWQSDLLLRLLKLSDPYTTVNLWIVISNNANEDK